MKLGHAASVVAAAALLAAQSATPYGVLSDVEADDKASLSPDGTLMAMTDWASGDVAIRNLSTGKLTRLLAKSGGWESDDFGEYATLSPDLKQVAYVWHEGSNPGYLRVIEREAGAKSRALVRNAEFPYVLPFGWSADCKFVFVHMWKKDYTAQLARVSVADGTFQAIRSLDWRRPARPSLSPDGRWIAYSALAEQDSSQDSFDSHIFVLASDGRRETVVVGGAGVNEAPVWTSDGKRILFSSNRSGKLDLWSVGIEDGAATAAPVLLKADIGKVYPIGVTPTGTFYYVHERAAEDVFLASLDGGKVGAPLVRLSENFAGFNRGPAWSPDGKAIAFKRRNQGNRVGYDLVIRTLASGEEKSYRTAALVGVPARPQWFHDGRSVLLAMADRQERISFHRVDLKSGQFTEVLAPSTAYLSLSVLSPDDATLYVTLNDEKNHTGAVAAYDLETGGYHKVFTTPGFINNFALSRDGRSIAMALSVAHEGHWSGRLCVAGIDGGNFRELYRPDVNAAEQDVFGGGPMLAWTLDDKAILFSQGSRQWQLMRVPAEGGPAELIGLATTGLGHALTLSPDGSRIAFSHGKATVKEMRVIENLLKAAK